MPKSRRNPRAGLAPAVPPEADHEPVPEPVPEADHEPVPEPVPAKPDRNATTPWLADEWVRRACAHARRRGDPIRAAYRVRGVLARTHVVDEAGIAPDPADHTGEYLWAGELYWSDGVRWVEVAEHADPSVESGSGNEPEPQSEQGHAGTDGSEWHDSMAATASDLDELLKGEAGSRSWRKNGGPTPTPGRGAPK